MSTSPEPVSPVLVEISAVCKTYPGVAALSDVSLSFNAGEVHALVGENGAGKSTLMKVVAGAVPQDTGRVRICGQPMPPGEPRASAAAGLAMIYQELTIAPDMSAARNVFLGSLPDWHGVIDRRRMRSRFAELSSQIGVDIDPDLVAGQLPVAKQQLLEIMRALAEDRQVVVFDEPTAALGPGDRQHLHDVVRQLRDHGRAVVYISHDLEEVLNLSDKVTVMREGHVVRTAPSTEWSKTTLVTAMLGRSLGTHTPRSARLRAISGPLMRVAHVNADAGAVQVDHLEIHPGEILGIGGLMGAGRSELLRALAGADPTASGSLFIGGRSRRWPRSVAEAISNGVALVPEDRKAEGLSLGQRASTNVLLSDLGAAARRGWFSPRKALQVARPPCAQAGFDPDRLAQPAGTLSGGNQQKLLLARWMHRQPRLLLLDEPTRGIDIGSKAAVFTAIEALAQDGMAVILVSSDLEEVAAHSDRVVVLSRGRLSGELSPPTTVEAILHLAFATELDAGPDSRTGSGGAA